MAIGDPKMLLLNWMKCAREAAEAMKPEARVLAAEELIGVDGPVFVEYNPERLNNHSEWMFVEFVAEYVKPSKVYLIRKKKKKVVYNMDRAYGITWRCWDRRPTEEQRREEAWKAR